MKIPNILVSFLLITLVIMLGFSGCKKYEEDDYWFTLRSVKNRLKGKQHLVEYTIDGKDSLQFFKDYYGDFYIEFSHEALSSNGKKLTLHKAIDDQQIGSGWWTFNESIENHATNIIFATDYLDVSIYSSPKLRIKKLTKDEFHLEGNTTKINSLYSNKDSISHQIIIKFKKL